MYLNYQTVNGINLTFIINYIILFIYLMEILIMNKAPLLLTAICVGAYRLTLYLSGNLWLSFSIFTIPIFLLFLNFVLRGKLTFKNWFLSPKNLFLERKSYLLESDITPDLVFEKLIENINELGMELLDSDTTTLSLLCKTNANLLTWGENIYIQIHYDQGISYITFTSVTMFGNNSWKRNQKNLETFVASFEKSLIV